MKGRLLRMLDPLGRFSPLNPRHRLNPLRSLVVPRRPPGSVPESGHASLLARIYGDVGSLDLVPAPNMEWWWQTLNVTDGDGVEYSVITNVQIFGVPLSGWVAQATVAVREVKGGRLWEAHTSGAFDPSDDARFTASGWRLGFEGNEYVVDVETIGLELHLRVELGHTAFLGDLGGKRGWYDLNPDGLVPIWASYRSRFGRQNGGQPTMRLGLRGYKLAEVISRFDQQSLHFSPRDVGVLSLPVLAEGLLLSPQWLWYHARLEHNGEHVNLMLCKVINSHTGTTMKIATALCDDDGNTELLDSGSIEFIEQKADGQLQGRIKAPRKLLATFHLPLGPVLQRWAGHYRITLVAESGSDWTVRYPIVGPLRYEAQEVPIEVEGWFQLKDQDKKVVTGKGTQEVLDLLKSVSLAT